MKKRLALFLAFALACAIPMTMPVSAGEEAPAASVAGEENEFHTGAFRGIAPEGWRFFPERKEDTLVPDRGSIFKGAETEEDMKKTAGIDIRCYKKKDYEEKDQRDLYDDLKDVEMEVEGREWTGFTGEYNHSRSLVLECQDEKCVWVVTGVMETGLTSFTVEDEDFRKILASLEYIGSGKDHEHDYELSYEVELTCTTDGYKVFVCTECGDYEIRDYEYAEGHDWERLSGGSPSTCTEPGFKPFRCSVCGEEYEEELELAPHDFQYTYTENPTCIDDGFDLYNCSMCGMEDYRNPVPANGIHSYYYLSIDSFSHSMICASCDDTVIDAHHMYDGVCQECGYSGETD